MDAAETLHGELRQRGAVLFLCHVADFRRDLAAGRTDLPLHPFQGVGNHVRQDNAPSLANPVTRHGLADPASTARDHRRRSLDLQHRICPPLTENEAPSLHSATRRSEETATPDSLLRHFEGSYTITARRT